MAHALPDFVVSELEKLDPAGSVPLRYRRRHHHHTWAQTFHSHPELYLQPESLEEIQLVVNLARRCRRRIVVVGCGHSPNHISCSSSWMVNLDNFSRILRVDAAKKIVTAQAGIRLSDFAAQAKRYDLTMPNLGSIDAQSIGGVIATSTHGSSLYHGLLSEDIKSLRIILANGRIVRCSADQNAELFRAALVSLGTLGIIVEVEYQMIGSTRLEFEQTMEKHSTVLDKWDQDLWTSAEFTRVWWIPYMKRAVVWKADKTDKPSQSPLNTSGVFSRFVTQAYTFGLWLGNYFPRILPTVEYLFFGIQHGFAVGTRSTGVADMHDALLMDCLFSQFVNEWGIPLHKGPEALRRLTAWINHDDEAARIPVSSKGIWVHAPIEVRVSDTTRADNKQPRPYMDFSCPDGPTLWLNAIIYRPYSRLQTTQHVLAYYQAFEYLMRELGGRPHWAKNFVTVDRDALQQMYGADLTEFRRIRQEIDPDGMFVGPWHRKMLLPPPEELPLMPLEESSSRTYFDDGFEYSGSTFQGILPETRPQESIGVVSRSSEESFDVLHGAEAEASQILVDSSSDTEKED
jgi:D-arabinono-1,4-lactone oxidase